MWRRNKARVVATLNETGTMLMAIFHAIQIYQTLLEAVAALDTPNQTPAEVDKVVVVVVAICRVSAIEAADRITITHRITATWIVVTSVVVAVDRTTKIVLSLAINRTAKYRPPIPSYHSKKTKHRHPHNISIFFVSRIVTPLCAPLLPVFFPE